MASARVLVSTSQVSRLCRPLASSMSSSSSPTRFGTSNGDSGWRWDNNGVGMGGKDQGPGTEAKPDVGKGKNYQVPEYFQYNKYSFHDVEMDMAKGRVPQPKSGLSEFWGGSGKATSQ